MKGKDIRCVRYTVLTIRAGKTPFSDWYAPLLHYRKPGVTGRGLYELKPEYFKEYNPFFYHYTRIDQSKVCTLVSNFERVSGKCNKTKIRATAKNTKKVNENSKQIYCNCVLCTAKHGKTQLKNELKKSEYYPGLTFDVL